MKNIFDWIATRERDNFFYTKGSEISCSLTCRNSLVISDENSGYIKGKNNYAIIKNKGKTKSIPISEIEIILNEIPTSLSKGKIFYKKPKSIYNRENLNHIELKKIENILAKCYGRNIKEISEIQNLKGLNRIYKIISTKNEKFIFKYRGNDANLFGAQAKILSEIKYFPKIIPTLNSNLNINFKGSIYALEEFLGEGKFSEPKERYFELIGKHMALMHNQINFFLKRNKYLESLLLQEGNFLSESNLISMRIDLNNENEKSDILLAEIYNLFNENLSEKLHSLPNQVIHGDLNRSNLIWDGKDTKIIDSENLRFSKRVKEFIPPLLFKGNFQHQVYTPNSIKEIISSYNLFSKNKLTQGEKDILPNLLKTYLIKLDIIYNLRRNKKNKSFRNQIIKDLEILGEDLNVY